jgi:hypothetical protein
MIKTFIRRRKELTKINSLELGELYFPRPVFRDIHGIITIWPAQHTSLFQRFIYKLYKRYVNRIYLPETTTVNFVGLDKKKIVIRNNFDEVYKEL